MLKNIGITFKLRLYILTGILIIYTSILLLNYYSTRKLLINSLKKDVTHLAQATVNEISGVLACAEKIPLNLAPILENVGNNEPKLRNSLEPIVLINKEVFGACVAFEPYSFNPDQYFFAPYYYRCGESACFKMLGEQDYDYFDLDWYQIPKLLEKPLWSEPYFDKNGGNIIMSTFSAPFYKNVNGVKKFNGIVTVDLDLSWLRNIVDSMDIIKNGFAFLISKKGTFLTHPVDSLVMNESVYSLADAINSPQLRQIGKQMINGETAYARIDPFDVDKKALLYFTPLPNNNWSLGIIFPEKELFAGLDAQFRIMLFLGVVGVILLFIVITIISKNITRPLEKLAAIAGELGEGNFDVQLPAIKSKDEIGRLTHSFDVMKRELKVYIKNLEETTAAKNKIESELKIAHDIQQGIIPKTFPPFPDRDDVDIYAILDPAREVGGDLYDFFFLDKTHLLFAVGDVSGKGVPASLFMAITRTLLRAKANLSYNVGEIMTNINLELCKDNENAMFVTFFVGILDLQSGEFEYCNAGHPFPYILRENGELHVIDQTHGMPVGLFDAGAYKQSKLFLTNKDSVVIYTDGVSEAFNEKRELMGTPKLEGILTGVAKENSPKVITKTLLNETRKFVGNAEQSDDITILVMSYFQQAVNEAQLT
jgi:sigma-B regulation protein RsbU (phosphoserine phosphatase)